MYNILLTVFIGVGAITCFLNAMLAEKLIGRIFWYFLGSINLLGTLVRFITMFA